MLIRSCIALLLTFSSVGCVTFQDCEYKAAQKYRAHVAWWCSCEERCSSNPFSHYSRGWRRGYSDVLMGGDGQCPPVPPTCYWSHKYQSENGEICIENWFTGYGDGAAAALNSCGNDFNPVPLSNTFRSDCPVCLPSDQSPYEYGKTILGHSRVSGAPVDDSDSLDTDYDQMPPVEKSSEDQVVPPQPVGPQTSTGSSDTLVPASASSPSSDHREPGSLKHAIKRVHFSDPLGTSVVKSFFWQKASLDSTP